MLKTKSLYHTIIFIILLSILALNLEYCKKASMCDPCENADDCTNELIGLVLTQHSCNKFSDGKYRCSNLSASVTCGSAKDVTVINK